ncbi:unnamed protein product [Rotaria sordida]|uniref:Uncharacterized protein n=1 Tax=Rotaria sordida TaxID=392033 RepID=A0A818M5N8_9BILA|nr:unnamed protein product [Rotaria sordida]CAF0782378.1 unnamed protein product [Rotaria sordida]CAF0783737.1 unnamed protein product [Rotaria sordida]CAF0785575.1 unnamed protein product [Rotaria sordida]CAF0792773.1 unnamed protein product [Rotaria sordida]
MANTKIILIWCWWLLVLIQSICSNLRQVQFMSFCNQTINISSPLSILFTPTSLSYTICCNITLDKSYLSNSSEQIIINIHNMSEISSSFQIFNKQMQSIELFNYLSLNHTFIKTDIIDLPLIFSLCHFDIQSFEILITNISKGPCILNQYRCFISNQDQWCIDDIFHCDGYHSCPRGIDELGCPKSMSRVTLPKMKRTIRGGVVTTIIILGLLLIISSVSIAVAFVYFQRKRQRRRQFTYSLESTSDDWEPSGTGYHLFDNWTNNRRSTGNNMNNIIIDSNEHMPITTTITNR